MKSTMKKLTNIFYYFTLIVTLIFIIYSGWHILTRTYVIGFKVLTQDYVAKWITLLIASTGFLLLLQRFSEQRKLNEKTINKYHKDKIEQHLFQLLKLHNDHLKELRSTEYTISNTGETSRTVNLVDKILTEFDAIVSCFTFLDNPVFDDIDWRKDARNIELFRSRLHSIGLREKYDHLDERLAHIGSWGFTAMFTGVISKFTSYEVLHSSERSKIHFWAYQLLFLGANPSNMSDLRKKIDSNHTYLAFESIINNLSIPLHGYQNQLSPFFKIYHQAVIYTDSMHELTYNEKYQYLKMFRGSMNTREQTLFFYNVISGFKQNWQRSNVDLISKYNIIKNIPQGFSAFRYEPDTFFPEICYEGQDDTIEKKMAHYEKYNKLDNT